MATRRPSRCLRVLHRAWVQAACGCVLALPGAVRAHETGGPAAPPLWQAWSGEASLWLLWGLPGLLVLAGFLRLGLRRRAVTGRGAGTSTSTSTSTGTGPARCRAASFLAGWVVLGVALLSPLDALGQVRFWAHMLQHELLLLLAAPLLVRSRPLAQMLWGLPGRWRPVAARRLARMAQLGGLAGILRGLTRPLAAWSLHAVVLWGWHAPGLFQAALAHRWVHDLQHASFLASGLVFWWSVLEPPGGRRRQAAAVLSLFTTLLHTSALGALLTLSPRAWYPAYGTAAPLAGLDALADQQLGGLIMWVPGGLVFLAAALAACRAALLAPATAHRAPSGCPSR